MPELSPVSSSWEPPAASRDDAFGVLSAPTLKVSYGWPMSSSGPRGSRGRGSGCGRLSATVTGTCCATRLSRAYLRAAVINRCRSGQGQLIRARRVRGRLDSVDWLEPSPETRAVEHDDARRLAAAVRSLPTRQREVVVCRYLSTDRGGDGRAARYRPGFGQASRPPGAGPARTDSGVHDEHRRASGDHRPAAVRPGHHRDRRRCRPSRGADRGTAAPHTFAREVRSPWDLTVAACAVVALVLAVTARRSGRTETMPAAPPTTGTVSSVSRADLTGVWMPEHGNSLGHLWLFTADGRWTTTNTARGFRDAAGELVPYDLEAGDTLRFGTCRKAVRLGTEGRMTLSALPGETTCDRFPESSLPFIRISPSSLPGNFIQRQPYAGPPTTARKASTMDDVGGAGLVAGERGDVRRSAHLAHHGHVHLGRRR